MATSIKLGLVCKINCLDNKINFLLVYKFYLSDFTPNCLDGSDEYNW